MKTEPAVVLLGPPASGKGTQAERLATHLGADIIATGKLLRRAVDEGSDMGEEVQRYMQAGELVPDDLILRLVRRHLRSREETPVVFDGFPRTLAQAEALEAMRPPTSVFFIDIPEETAVHRISGRRLGRDGESYHLVFNPPPPGIEVVQRPDDSEEVVRERFEVYRERTQPVLELYERQAKLHRIRGEDSIEEIAARIRSLL